MKFYKKSLNFFATSYEKFFQYEASAGILLIFVTFIALIVSNSPLAEAYFSIWNIHLTIGFENFRLDKPLILWINDGLMAIFFFLVGLEIKREILVGELSQWNQAVVPIGAAIGGMLLPALFFFLIEKEALSGWAIPMATDIAFSLGILKLLGNRVPVSLKIFLTAFAIIDDIGAVIVIAIFYSSNVNLILIGISLIVLLGLIFLNLLNITKIAPYVVFGILLWLLFLKAGIHPTIAAVILAFTIPAKPKVEILQFVEILEDAKHKFHTNNQREKEILLTKQQYHILENLNTSLEAIQSPIQKLEHRLHGFVSYFIMPVFAFANAGVMIRPDTFGDLSISIATSLILGKFIGVILVTYLILYLFKADLPTNSNFKQIVGIGFLAGVGFTMSLFINNLSYTDNIYLDQARLGILLGSLISGTLGYIVLFLSSKEKI
jgi:NhaA family Na+:H+ antiporter